MSAYTDGVAASTASAQTGVFDGEFRMRYTFFAASSLRVFMRLHGFRSDHNDNALERGIVRAPR